MLPLVRVRVASPSWAHLRWWEGEGAGARVSSGTAPGTRVGAEVAPACRSTRHQHAICCHRAACSAPQRVGRQGWRACASTKWRQRQVGGSSARHPAALGPKPQAPWRCHHSRHRHSRLGDGRGGKQGQQGEGQQGQARHGAAPIAAGGGSVHDGAAEAGRPRRCKDGWNGEQGAGRGYIPARSPRTGTDPKGGARG